MTPKEKASDLVYSIFDDVLTNNSQFDDSLNSVLSRYQEAKKCALKTIEFALENPLNSNGYISYLYEIKQEIENL